MNRTNTAGETIAEIDHLTKRFDTTTALDDVTLALPRGSIVGLIGRNGAGKTTLLRHLTGLLLPTSGQVTVLGCPAEQLGEAELNRIGAVDQEGDLLEWMTVEQHVRYVAAFYRNWDRALEEELIGLLELDRKSKISALSGGDRQKVSLVIAVGHRPELLLLDEPISALDPIVRERTLDFLLDLLRESGTTIVISSHILRDVEKIVDRIVCLNEGRLVEVGPLDEIQERHAEWIVTSTAASIGPGQSHLPERFIEPFVLRQSVNGIQARLEVRDGASQIEEFKRRHKVDVAVRPLSVERVLLALLEGER